MAQQFVDRVNSLFGPILSMQYTFSTKTEAKAISSQLTAVQKEARLIKKEIALQEKEIRTQFTNERLRISSRAVGNRFAGRGFYGKLIRANTANARASLQQEEQNAVAPYEQLRSYIDGQLVALDRLKLDIEQKALNLPK